MDDIRIERAIVGLFCLAAGSCAAAAAVFCAITACWLVMAAEAVCAAILLLMAFDSFERASAR